MTPEFEKRLEDESNRYMKQECPRQMNRKDIREAYRIGAHWGYQQGIRDALYKLRGNETAYMTVPAACDWLEQQFKRDGV